jgi:hypothetical protein
MDENENFVKIYGSILQSSLLLLPVHVRWCFVAMLAAAKADGRVRTPSVRTLAHLVNLTPEETESALAILEAPDPDSTTPDHEGRRVIREQGCWFVVNHKLYREHRSKRQIAEAARKAESRHAVKHADMSAPSVSRPQRPHQISDLRSDLSLLTVEAEISPTTASPYVGAPSSECLTNPDQPTGATGPDHPPSRAPHGSRSDLAADPQLDLLRADGHAGGRDPVVVDGWPVGAIATGPASSGAVPPAPPDGQGATLVAGRRSRVAKRLPVAGPSVAVWEAYAEAYHARYGDWPVRNARVNSQLAQFAARVPASEAPDIARHYLRSNYARYVGKGHTAGCLLEDAEKLRTEWATGKHGTAHAAREADKRTGRGEAYREMFAELRALDIAEGRVAK